MTIITQASEKTKKTNCMVNLKVPLHSKWWVQQFLTTWHSNQLWYWFQSLVCISISVLLCTAKWCSVPIQGESGFTMYSNQLGFSGDDNSVRWITELARLINGPTPYGWPYWAIQWADGLVVTGSRRVSAPSKWPHFKFMIWSGLKPAVISSLKSAEKTLPPAMTSSATALWPVGCQINGRQTSGPLPWRDFQLVEGGCTTEEIISGVQQKKKETKKWSLLWEMQPHWCRLVTSQLQPQVY